MRFKLSFLLILFCISFVFPHHIIAEELNKNKFGIHITNVDEVDKAAALVNSSGGEWGYVAIVINSNDRNVQKWQERFNLFNEKKLIPIVRLATYGNGDNWVKPTADDPKDWAKFLNNVYWPTKKKIVVIGNEPNHSTEWGGETNPVEYAQYLRDTIEELKRINKDFFVVNAGFDSSSPQKPPRYMDQVAFMDEMNKAVPGVFELLDGWATHSYPNPGFSGHPTDIGRGTITNYKWEIDLLRTRYNITKHLPVLITETGWIIKNDDHPTIKLDEAGAAENYEHAFNNVWLKDDQVQAIVPFLLSYKESLFSHFSWLKPDNTETMFYLRTRDIPKQSNQPERADKSVITRVSIPIDISERNEFIATVAFKNTGNTIWSANDGYTLSSIDEKNLIKRSDFSIPANIKIYPGHTNIFRFTLYTETIYEKTSIGFQMKKSEEEFGEKLYVPIKIYKNPTINLSVANPPNLPVENVTIEFFNDKDTDVISNTIVPTNGQIGTYKSKMFVPDKSLGMRIVAPNRETVTRNFIVKEGENFIVISLPPERPWWLRIFS